MYLCSCVGVFLFILYCLPVTTAPIELPGSVEIISATEAIVQWRPLSQSSIDGYQVRYWMNHEGSRGVTQTVLVPSSEKQIRLEGMKANSHYLIEVRAYNSAGYGPPSERLQIHTKKAPPSQPPEIKSQTLKGQSIHIVWERAEPLDNEARVDGYKVLYKEQNNPSGTLYTTTRNYIQLPLPANGSYVVEIRAFTEEGDGPVTRIENTAPSEAPESVVARVISATEASVQWLPLSQSNIDGYQVRYWMNHEDSEGAQRVMVTSSRNQTILEGMKANSHYLIEVRAYNSAGYGPPSERLQIHTKKAPPSQPPKINSQTLKGQSIHIVWERAEPLDNEARVDGYKVLYKEQNNPSGTLYTTTRNYIQLPLPANGSYVVEIRAFTEEGDGPVTRIENTAPSEAPESVVARVISATEASVQWLPLSQSNIDGYQVRYWMNHEDSEGAQRVMVTSSRNQTILEGMKANSHYLIEVRAYNSAGYGPPSERLQIHTKKAPPSQPPKINSQTLKGQSIHIVWERAEPLDNEARVNGYKVLYKEQNNPSGTLYTTTRNYIQLPLPANGSYVVEIRAFTEEGDGPVTRIENTEPRS